MTIVEMIKNVVIPSVKANVGWVDEDLRKDPNTLVKGVINTILIIVVIAAVIFIMFAGIQYISSSGDANKAKAAMSSITNAIIGLVVAFAAYVLVNVVINAVFGNSVTQFSTLY
jgi:amino acid transporter